MSEQVYTNYRLALPEGDALGTLVVRGALIADIQPGGSAVGLDGHGEWLLPGLIELHTDTLENCAAPRPGVSWPLELAVVHQDRLLVGAGITTACNALAVRDVPCEGPASLRVAALIRAVAEAQAAGRLVVDHFLHLRCEVTCASAADILARHLADPRLALVSVMDHRPGQRQFLSLERLHRYYFGKYGLAPSEVDEFLREGQLSEDAVCVNRREIVRLVRAGGLALASHDDATREHVSQAQSEGAVISEFPTTWEAAARAGEAGLSVLLGAPNVVLGGSHSGNLSALDAARRGRLDLLSSDYAPHSLLPAVFRLACLLDFPLSRALIPVTAHPARVLGLTDRGSLTPGSRADFLTVRHDGIVHRITSVTAGGRRVG